MLTKGVIIFACGVIGLLATIIWILVDLIGRDKKEKKLLAKAIINSSKQPVRQKYSPVVPVKTAEGLEKTEAVADAAAGLNDAEYTVGLSLSADETIGLQDDFTEGLIENEATEALVDNERTEGLIETEATEALVDNERTEGLIENEATEALIDNERTEGLIENEATEALIDNEKTEGLIENEATGGFSNQNKAKFCINCGAPITGNGQFCTQCGFRNS